MTITHNDLIIKNQSCKGVWQIASNLSKIIKTGDILLLKGTIGSGKSFFARSIINEYFKIARIYEDIPSPSFSIVQTYDNIKPCVCHVDLYRLSFMNELEEIGLENIYENFVTIIEWPERLGIKRPKRFLQIELMHSKKIEDERDLKINIVGPNWENLSDFLTSLKIFSGEKN